MSSLNSTVSGIEKLPGGSVDLLRQVNSPFLDLQWFSIFEGRVARHIGKPLWFQLRRDTGVIALLPMLERPVGKLRILAAMSNYYSPYFDLLAARVPSENLYSHFIEHLQSALNTYHLIDLSPLTEDVCLAFKDAFINQGWHCHQYTLSINWRERHIGDFGDYWKKRPRQLRDAVKRKGRKLSCKPHRWQIIQGEPNDEQLADYHHVYYRSWKPQEPYPIFIDELVRQLARRGEVTLGLLYIDDIPVAAQIWIFRGRTGYIYKLAYDPAYGHLSPGTLLSARLFEHAISERRVETIDYLTGDDQYKRQWTSESRPLFGLQAANLRTLRGASAGLRNRLSELWHYQKGL
jgi:hypothetical protein